jgi:hypothetical protein
MVPRRLAFFRRGQPRAHDRAAPRPAAGAGGRRDRVLLSRAMRQVLLAVALAAVTLTACGGGVGRGAPASAAVRELVAALRADDPRRAYALLSADTRKQVSYDEFALQWKQHAAERAWQAAALEETLRGDPDVGERALASYPDGKTVALEREGKAWRLESHLVAQSRASRPRDAIRIFAQALHDHDLDGVLRTLTLRRRAGLAAQLEGFLAGLDRRVDAKIDEIGTDRAELRWDESDIQYVIVLRKEEGEWRIDDIKIRPAEPKEDDDATDEGLDD